WWKPEPTKKTIWWQPDSTWSTVWWKPDTTTNKAVQTASPALRLQSPRYSYVDKQFGGKCYRGDGYYADFASGCRHSYLCIFLGKPNAQVQSHTCPNDLLFDDLATTCNFPHLVSCHPTTLASTMTATTTTKKSTKKTTAKLRSTTTTRRATRAKSS